MESINYESGGSQEQYEQTEIKEEEAGYDPALAEKLRRQIDISRRANYSKIARVIETQRKVSNRLRIINMIT